MLAFNKFSYHKRLLINILATSFSVLTVLLTLYFLGWILFTLFKQGFSSISISVFTQITPPPGESGGLINPIMGSFMMVSIAIAVAAVIGVFVAIYLSEYGRNTRLSYTTRFVNDVLLGVPSVILGLFVYEVFIVWQGHFSGWGGAIALSIIAIPIIIRVVDGVFSLVPKELRESAVALGVPTWKIVLWIIIPISKAGVITGILLALARISGETAPLLFTALNNQFWSTDMNRPLASLPIVIFQFAMSPYDDWKKLAWSGALILTLFVLSINIIVRIVFRKKIIVN